MHPVHYARQLQTLTGINERRNPAPLVAKAWDTRHMSQQSVTSRAVLAAAFLAVAAASLVLGIWLSQRHSTADAVATVPPGLEATYLPQGKPLRSFDLVDHDEQPFTQDRLQNRWTFLFFGFTNCPDVCPMALQVMRGVTEQVKGQAPVPQVVFVSVDPERDPPATLKAYVRHFDPEFLGVTGKIDQIDALTRHVGVLYGYEDPDPETGDYTVNHSAQILLIDPQARLRAVFSTPHDVNAMARDFLKIRQLDKG